ncbi:F-box/LRR-repeat protein 4-like [Artemia franciscana]|uniref:F-box domain-containing protein n=2 Tax=Artemia franciscana TaxID=6661 RepID=A0AA88I920_ARTSF|nr:hypothetical protein QYM36_006282 [Artemia franciscana]KAK2717452.1 hypothetical protein QYM36_006282 [Artemia franciscana]
METKTQFVETIADFSDHYAEDRSYSYSVFNLIGECRLYPKHQESSQTFSSRHHKFTACKHNFQKRRCLSTDFIDVKFEMPVYPIEIAVYETYSPGYITGISCKHSDCTWTRVYQELYLPSVVIESIARKLVVAVKNCKKSTMLLRVEFCAIQAAHFIGIDAVELSGTIDPPSIPKLSSHPIIKKIISLIPFRDIARGAEECLLQEEREYSHLQEGTDAGQSKNLLLDLPKELYLKIFKYLELPDICRLRTVSRALYELASDSSLFVIVDTRSFWYKVSSDTLVNVGPLLEYTKRLDLSWCGPYGRISPAHFTSFIRACGCHLTHLYLENCHFMNSDSLYWIISSCKYLEEISLQGCSNIDSDGFVHISMVDRLKKLWIGRTKVKQNVLHEILHDLPELTHLGLGSCDLREINHLVATIKEGNPGMKVLDLWRAGDLDMGAIEQLSSLTQLEELEIGWCACAASVRISQLVQSFQVLKKLGLAGLRVISDADLLAIADCCPNLESLDVTGNREITEIGCSRIILNCSKLKYLDISYCDNVGVEEIQLWRKMFPEIVIVSSKVSDL